MKNERKTTFLLITVPILALFVCFNTIPLIRGVIYSFTNFKGFGSYDWVGFRNYIDLFTDARVGKSYLFTFKLAVVTTIVVNVISLILALALNSKIRAKSFFRWCILPSQYSWCTGCRLHIQLLFYLYTSCNGRYDRF